MPARACPLPPPRASTEPRAHARGKSTTVSPGRSRASGFNGATRSRAWKEHHLPRLVERLEASTEPRAHARGKKAFVPLPMTTPEVLQRSHALTRVESDRGHHRYADADEASTEPRAHARGKPATAHECETYWTPLQRSHALTRVERVEDRIVPGVAPVASTEPRAHARGKSLRSRRRSRGRRRFNGATRSRAWKGTIGHAITPMAQVLQRSHALTRVERAPRRLWPARGRAASTEPRAHARGKDG